jgi:hypothetical protein
VTLEAKMSKEAALEILCLACTTLMTEDKIVYGSELAGELTKAAAVLGAFQHTPSKQQLGGAPPADDKSRHRDEAVTASSRSRTQHCPRRDGTDDARTR